MSQDITFVAVKKIKSAKSIKKGLAQTILDQLYDSISKEGLFNPIIVRPNPESQGYYKLVAGEHRYYVVAKMMKEEVIACRVFEDMSDEEAELASLSENTCRTNAKPIDRLLMLRKWQEVYRKFFPCLERKKLSGNSRWANSTKAEAKQKAIEEEKAQDAAVTAAAAAESVTGMSDATITRELKITEGLDEEQVYALRVVECTEQDILRIVESTTDDKTKRAEIVSLVCSGMEIDRAIKEVLSVSTTKEEAGRIK